MAMYDVMCSYSCCSHFAGGSFPFIKIQHLQHVSASASPSWNHLCNVIFCCPNNAHWIHSLIERTRRPTCMMMMMVVIGFVAREQASIATLLPSRTDSRYCSHDHHHHKHHHGSWCMTSLQALQPVRPSFRPTMNFLGYGYGIVSGT